MPAESSTNAQRSGPAPLHALLPGGRQAPTKTRVFLDALAARLKAREP